MGSKPRHKMSTLDRAKQFAPFSALKGLEKALRQKEAEAESRKYLTDEAMEDMDVILRTLAPGQTVTVTYYDGEEYRTVTGETGAVDSRSDTLFVDGHKIPFADLYSLCID